MLIAFEGVDGSGKSTTAKQLKNTLLSHGYDVVYLHNPTDVCNSPSLKEFIANNSFETYTQFLMFCSGHYEIAEKHIKPALAQNKIVIIDRYVDSTLAYQWYKMDTSRLPYPKEILPSSVFPYPDFTIYMDCSYATANKRVMSRNEKGMDEDFFNDISNAYLSIISATKKSQGCEKSKSNYICINTDTPDRQNIQIYQILNRILDDLESSNFTSFQGLVQEVYNNLFQERLQSFL